MHATHQVDQGSAHPDIILKASQVSKKYPGTLALDNVDFNVYRGKVNVLVGENGAGKSTLMKIIAGAIEISSGKILLENKEITIKNVDDAAKYGIGIVYQELNLFPNLNIAENIFMKEKITMMRLIILKMQSPTINFIPFHTQFWEISIYNMENLIKRLRYWKKR